MENATANWQAIAYIAFIQLLFHLPTIIVYVIGIVAAFLKSKEHPKVSLFSGIGFAVLLILTIASISTVVLPAYFSGQGYSLKSISYVLSTIGFITTIIAAAASALLLSAIWKDRR